MERRPLGNTDIMVSPVAFGGWPITGITTLDVNESDSLASIRTGLEMGINFFDTAYMYGANGESEQLIGRAVADCRDEIVVATKGGAHWDEQKNQVYDGRRERLRFECEESLRRLDMDYVDLLYLHAPDPKVPVAESAGALRELMDEGKARAIGTSNMTVDQLDQFHVVCPVAAYQPPYSMLQRQIEEDTLPWCREQNVAVMAYWPLMMGLLAGKLTRDRVFPARDGERNGPCSRASNTKRTSISSTEFARLPTMQAQRSSKSWSTGPSINPVSQRRSVARNDLLKLAKTPARWAGA